MGQWIGLKWFKKGANDGIMQTVRFHKGGEFIDKESVRFPRGTPLWSSVRQYLTKLYCVVSKEKDCETAV